LLAIASSFTNRVIPSDVIAIGEVGLGGEVRGVSRIETRLKEAIHMGFKKCVLPRKRIVKSLGDGRCRTRSSSSESISSTKPSRKYSRSRSASLGAFPCASTVKCSTQLHRCWPHVTLTRLWVETVGDQDRKTVSLRSLGKTDFFTREIDELLLHKQVRLGVHSAKDLPDPLPRGLCVAALTEGLDPRDSLVFKNALRPNCLVATSSERREAAVRSLYPEARFVDVRGTIKERLQLVERDEVDGVVVAEAALIRLQLTHLNRIFLPGETVAGQGQLAVVCRSDDTEMQRILRSIDSRREKQVLYLGLDPTRFSCRGHIIHHPVIKTVPITQLPAVVHTPFTHVLFTSPTAVKHWFSFTPPRIDTVLAIGLGTASILRSHGIEPLVAPIATQEGMIALLETLPLEHARLLWPRSAQARSLLGNYLREKQIAHEIVDLYHTVPNLDGKLVNLDEIDEIVFTSPSTVNAFMKMYEAVPEWVKVTGIGPVTEKSLLNHPIRCFLREPDEFPPA
jgi:hydroxymethylbilane synthase